MNISVNEEAPEKMMSLCEDDAFYTWQRHLEKNTSFCRMCMHLIPNTLRIYLATMIKLFIRH